MTKMMKAVLAGTALFAVALSSSNALAAPVNESVVADAEILQAIVFAETQNFDFGSIAVGPVGGTVVLDTADGTTCTGDIECVGAPTSAALTITGQNGETAIITAANSVLSGPGTDMNIGTFVFSNSGTQALTGGADAFTVGATLTVAGGQTPGAYTGNVTISAVYQ